MHRKPKNKSSDKYIQQRHIHVHYERKCQTPSQLNNQKKKPKSKDKSSADKKRNSSIKNIKASDRNHQVYGYNYQYHLPSQPYGVNHKKQSPFKHKNRPVSNLNNARHAKNIDHQLSNLNQSVFRHDSSYLDQSDKKIRYDTVTGRIMDEGRKHMKKNSFQKAISIFKETLHKDSDNIQALYLLGVSCFHVEQYQNCIKALNGVLLRQQHYRKNVYLFLAISYKKQGLVDEAILTLTKAISLYPKYYDAIILRAKILAKQKRYYDAIEDLNKCIKLDSQNIQAYVSKADCLRSLTQYKQAVILYSQVLDFKIDLQILLKRGIAYIQNGQIPQALQDLNFIISKNHNNSEAYLFKGLAYSKISNYNQAMLSYQQAIKFNTSKKATTKAIYEITKLKIELGDYYGASYTLERANSLQVDDKVLQKMKIFTQGSTSIMKKKYKKGIQQLSILCRKETLSDHLRPLLYSFRSYGYFCQHKFSSSLNDLKTLMKLGYQLDKVCQYNQILLQGILASQNNQFDEALSKFEQAQQSRPQLADPQIYKGLTKVCEYNRNPKNKDINLLQQAIKFISLGLKRQEHHNTYYLLACVQYELGDFQQALDNIEKAMNKSDDHVMKHLYLHGMLKGMLTEYKEAYKSFGSVMTIYNQIKQKENYDPQDHEKQKEIPQAYLNRAKCYLIFGEKKKAFQDLQTYIAKKPLDGQVHSVAGKLLFSIGAFEDAIKAYNYSTNIDKHRQTLEQRMKCYLLLKQLNYCLKDMEKMAQLGVAQVKYDYSCLDALRQASKGAIENYEEALKKLSYIDDLKFQNGVIFQQSDMYFYKGFLKFQLKDYAEALKLFTKSKNLKTLNNQLQQLQINQEGDVDDQQLQNRIYTDKQIEYNIAVTQLLLGKDSSQTLSFYQGFNELFEGKINEGAQIEDITPFPVSNRLCSIFPETIYKDKVKFKLSFCLPEVIPPQIRLTVDTKIVSDLNMGSTEPRPDAPWIKRNNYGVIFTDQIVGFDIDLKTEKSANQIQPIRIQSEVEVERLDEKSKLRQMLSLNDEVEQRLQKIMNKKQQRQQNI